MIELKNNPTGNFFLLAGPCVMEGKKMPLRIAKRIVPTPEKLQTHTYSKGRTVKPTVRVWIPLWVSVTKRR